MKAREGKDGYQLVEVVLRFNSIGKLTEGSFLHTFGESRLARLPAVLKNTPRWEASIL